ncbi:Receptor-like protein kinase HERK 1 [Glycine soja]
MFWLHKFISEKVSNNNRRVVPSIFSGRFTFKRFIAERCYPPLDDLFKNEIELLCQIRHPNCVSLIGFCSHKNERISVYEYMSNGSLDRYLEGSIDRHLQGGDMEALPWKKRLEICIGAARGLHYLHAGAKRTIFHRDIKPSNILLDHNMEPKLAGFIFSIKGPHSMSKPKPIQAYVAGTTGFTAREHIIDGTVTDKCDVYSFGGVLLEVLWGRKYVISPFEKEFLEKPIEEKIDLNIRGKIAPDCWKVFSDITQRCLKLEADERPTMGEVEVELEHALSLQDQADIVNTNAKLLNFVPLLFVYPTRYCKYSKIIMSGISEKKLIRIDASADTVCPWCFVGKKNLDKAIASSKDKYNFEIIWHPFQLNPDAPKEGIDKREFYRSKFGSQSERMEARMSEVFKNVGLEYSLSGLTGNTIDSHRLIYFARQQGLDKQHDLVEELNIGYFTQGKYIGDHKFLLESAAKVGIEGAEEFLKDPNNGLKEVEEELKNNSGNISGVPYYVINGIHKLSGGQAPEVFLRAFQVATT